MVHGCSVGVWDERQRNENGYNMGPFELEMEDGWTYVTKRNRQSVAQREETRSSQ